MRHISARAAGSGSSFTFTRVEPVLPLNLNARIVRFAKGMSCDNNSTTNRCSRYVFIPLRYTLIARVFYPPIMKNITLPTEKISVGLTERLNFYESILRLGIFIGRLYIYIAGARIPMKSKQTLLSRVRVDRKLVIDQKETT
jgi:hypothetical protein